MPRAANERGVLSECLDIQLGKFQLPHLVPFALVSYAITFAGWLPSGNFLRPREKREVWGIPVPGHESVQVVAVPGFDLFMDDVLNASLSIALRVCHRTVTEGLNSVERQEEKHEREAGSKHKRGSPGRISFAQGDALARKNFTVAPQA